MGFCTQYIPINAQLSTTPCFLVAPEKKGSELDSSLVSLSLNSRWGKGGGWGFVAKYPLFM